MDLRINFQRLRHSKVARASRKTLFHLFLGRDGWPIKFCAPLNSAPLFVKSSPNIYVHLPFCSSICPHCPYNKILFHPALYEAYRHALLRELRFHFQSQQRQAIQTLYFGGGTPSLHPELIGEIILLLKQNLAHNSEIGVEVHPVHATPEFFERLRTTGVNRISLAIETLHDQTLQFLERGYTSHQARRAVQIAVAAGFDCVDVNLIYGIPAQEWAEPVKDAIECLESGVDQISAYPLFTFVHTRLGGQVERKKVPVSGEFARLRSQKAIADVCLREGLERTSVWSYTRAGVSSYSTVTHDSYIGFGAGAGSKVDASFWFNTFSVKEYSKLEEPKPALMLELSERLHRFHWVYWQIYKTSLDLSEYQHKFGRSFEQDFGLLAKCLRLLGWCDSKSNALQVTERGALWAHRLQCLYSLTYIDKVWEQCRREAWPTEIVLH